MPDTDPNLTIDVTGNTGSIATEWVTTGGITNAHVQIVKLAWGDANTATRVRTSTPLPVTVVTASSTLGISGPVTGSGNFRVINGLSGATTLPLIVQGTTASGTTPLQISGTVEGVLNGTKVGITGDVTVTNTLRIQGTTGGFEIGITGGRRLNSATDSVTVSGTVGVSGGRYLLPATDGVKIYSGIDGGSTLTVKLTDGSGNSISSSGGALNVNLVGAGITATVSISPVVGISQANPNIPLYIAGATSGSAVRIKGGLTGGIVEVGWASALPVSIDPTSALNLTFDDTNTVSELQSIKSAITPLQTAAEAIQTAANTISSRIPSTQTYTTNTNINLSSNVYTGSIDLPSSGSMAMIPSTTLKYGITIKSLATGTSTTSLIRVYGSSPTGLSGISAAPYYLSPGESMFVSIDNTNKLKFQSNNSTATVSICFIAS